MLRIILALLVLSSTAAAQTAVQVYAKSGVVFGVNEPCVFTGGGGGARWEIDRPAVGTIAHCFTRTAVSATPTAPGTATSVGLGPAYVYLTESVAQGDELTPNGSTGYRRRGAAQVLAGYALKTLTIAGTGAGPVLLTTVNDLFTQLAATAAEGDMVVRTASAPKGWSMLRAGADGMRLEGRGTGKLPEWTSSYSTATRIGTGAEERIAHGLARTPRSVRCYLTGVGPGPIAARQQISEGSHSASEIVVTVPSNFPYRCEAE